MMSILFALVSLYVLSAALSEASIKLLHFFQESTSAIKEICLNILKPLLKLYVTSLSNSRPCVVL